MRLSLVFALSFVLLSLTTSAQLVTFTGNAAADFAGVAGSDVVTDPIGDVGVPTNIPNVSGWDIQNIFVAYDPVADKLFVGIDTFGIAGDADGDGAPGGTSAELTANSGMDFPDLGGTESVTFSFDLDCDNVVDVIVGVPFAEDINGFAIAEDLNIPLPPASFGAPIVNASITLFASPSAAQPDLEFCINSFSNIVSDYSAVGVDQIGIRAFAGSIDDDGIGEDFVPGFGMTDKVTLPLFAKIGDIVFADLDDDGIQDTGEPGVAGITVTLYESDGTTVLATATTDANGNYEFCVPPGDYVVGFSGADPSVFTGGFAMQDAGGKDDDDSDADPTTGLTGVISVGPDEVNDTIDAGLVATPASVICTPCGFDPIADPVFTMEPLLIGTQPKFTVGSIFPNAFGWIYFSLGTCDTSDFGACTFSVSLDSALDIFQTFTTDMNGDFCYQLTYPVPPASVGVKIGWQARICATTAMTTKGTPVPPGPFAPLPDFFSNGYLTQVGTFEVPIVINN